ncbi:MAG: lytic transglycosylase domain-containing protein [Rhodobacteraceae bacterium]|nr:lytic transglycosylase domain-containing protein [Paracoccaceae bacterium]
MAYPRQSKCPFPGRHAVRLAGLFVVLATVWASPQAAARTAADPAQLCEVAAQRAAHATGVPLAVLRAISLTETGRSRGGRTTPWPWTVNMEGKGKWFDDPQTAQSYVETHFKRGARSFDVGCFQLNYKWHGQGFSSITQMFDPQANALYAARFLAELYRETGDWSRAAGAYHSRTPSYANRYRDRFDRILAGLDAAPPAATGGTDTPQTSPPKTPAMPRINAYPLLQSGGTGRALGSLVPLSAMGGASLFAPRAEGG